MWSGPTCPSLRSEVNVIAPSSSITLGEFILCHLGEVNSLANYIANFDLFLCCAILIFYCCCGGNFICSWFINCGNRELYSCCAITISLCIDGEDTRLVWRECVATVDSHFWTRLATVRSNYVGKSCLWRTKDSCLTWVSDGEYRVGNALLASCPLVRSESDDRSIERSLRTSNLLLDNGRSSFAISKNGVCKELTSCACLNVHFVTVCVWKSRPSIGTHFWSLVSRNGGVVESSFAIVVHNGVSLACAVERLEYEFRVLGNSTIHPLVNADVVDVHITRTTTEESVDTCNCIACILSKSAHVHDVVAWVFRSTIVDSSSDCTVINIDGVVHPFRSDGCSLSTLCYAIVCIQIESSVVTCVGREPLLEEIFTASVSAIVRQLRVGCSRHYKLTGTAVCDITTLDLSIKLDGIAGNTFQIESTESSVSTTVTTTRNSQIDVLTINLITSLQYWSDVWSSPCAGIGSTFIVLSVEVLLSLLSRGNHLHLLDSRVRTIRSEDETISCCNCNVAVKFSILSNDSINWHGIAFKVDGIVIQNFPVNGTAVDFHCVASGYVVCHVRSLTGTHEPRTTCITEPEVIAVSTLPESSNAFLHVHADETA